jgi:hypothetical protein
MTLRDFIIGFIELIVKLGQDFVSIALFRVNWLDSPNVIMVIFVALIYWGLFVLVREIIKDALLHRKRYKTEIEYRKEYDLKKEKERKIEEEELEKQNKDAQIQWEKQKKKWVIPFWIILGCLFFFSIFFV